ncbi:MAG: SDR family NAD(P)-dependent oxidoreductase, partial [Parvularculaceae bacterium]
ETVSMVESEKSNRIRRDVLDVSNPASIEPYAQRVKESLGPADFLFNVAGISRIGRFKDTPLSSFERVMNVNYWGVVRMTKAFLPQLLETKGGVVNISSVFGLIAVPGQAHYCSSKFAVRGFNEAIATELETEGVRVTSVHPGGVATNIAKRAEIDALPSGASSREDVVARFDKIAITSPEKAAETIVNGAARGARRVIVGRDARLISLIQRLFPQSYPKIVKFMGGHSLN